MQELAFAARHIAASPRGPNTVFHFRDDEGKTLTLLLDGEVEQDFVDRCRIYYEPDQAGLDHAVFNPAPTGHLEHEASELEHNAYHLQIETAVLDLLAVDITPDDTAPLNIAEALNLELRRLMETPTAA